MIERYDDKLPDFNSKAERDKRIQDAYFGSIKKLTAKKNRGAYNNYTARKTDANQRPIVKAFRDAGFSVTLLHEAGDGVFDLLVAKSWLAISVEVKNPLEKDGKPKPPSARKFTGPQVEWSNRWPALKAVALTTDDVISIINEINRILSACAAAGIVPRRCGNMEEQYRMEQV